MLPLVDCCALEFHILIGGDEVPGQSTLPAILTTVCQIIQDSSIRLTLFPLIHIPQTSWRLLGGRSAAEQKALTSHALWENSIG